MKYSWIRKLIKGLSFTSVLFAFQACYGTDEGMGFDIFIEGQVKSINSNTPIQGIKVSVGDHQYEWTDVNGNFSFYTATAASYALRFEDTDSLRDGYYMDKDTLLTDIADHVYLDIALEEK
jgi:hypothetical protein